MSYAEDFGRKQFEDATAGGELPYLMGTPMSELSREALMGVACMLMKQLNDTREDHANQMQFMARAVRPSPTGSAFRLFSLRGLFGS